jgi:hypothetical protein
MTNYHSQKPEPSFSYFAGRLPSAGLSSITTVLAVRSSLTIHLAERSGVEPKAVKALLAALEETVLASIHKKGGKEFTLPALLKVVAQDVPAKKKRFGKDPFWDATVTSPS